MPLCRDASLVASLVLLPVLILLWVWHVRRRVAQAVRAGAEECVTIYVLEVVREIVVLERRQHLRVMAYPPRVDQIEVFVLHCVKVELKPFDQFLEVEVFFGLFVHFRPAAEQSHFDDGLFGES